MYGHFSNDCSVFCVGDFAVCSTECLEIPQEVKCIHINVQITIQQIKLKLESSLLNSFKCYANLTITINY